MTKTILISYHPPFIPICKQLAAQGYQFLCLNQEFAKVLSDLDLPAQSIGNFSQGLVDPAFFHAARIIQAVPRSLNGNSHGLGPQFNEFLAGRLPAFLYPRLSDLALIVLTLDRVKPHLVLLHNDVEPLTRVAALWARQRRVPCVHVPHAIYQDVNRGPAGTDVHDLITASHVAAAGPFQAGWYRQRGEADIKETGLPQFDRWHNFQADKPRARKLLKLNGDGPVIVYASTWPQATNAQGMNDEWAFTYQNFLQAVGGLSGVQVIVKLHPRSGEDAHKWHAEQAGKYQVPCAVTPLHNELILQAADLLLAYGGSNLVLEAAHVPGLRLMTTHGYTDDPEVTKVPLTVEGIRGAMIEALQLPAVGTGRFRAKYLGQDDGGASGRISQWVQELA